MQKIDSTDSEDFVEDNAAFLSSLHHTLTILLYVSPSMPDLGKAAYFTEIPKLLYSEIWLWNFLQKPQSTMKDDVDSKEHELEKKNLETDYPDKWPVERVTNIWIW